MKKESIFLLLQGLLFYLFPLVLIVVYANCDMYSPVYMGS